MHGPWSRVWGVGLKYMWGSSMHQACVAPSRRRCRYHLLHIVQRALEILVQLLCFAAKQKGLQGGWGRACMGGGGQGLQGSRMATGSSHENSPWQGNSGKHLDISAVCCKHLGASLQHIESGQASRTSPGEPRHASQPCLAMPSVRQCPSLLDVSSGPAMPHATSSYLGGFCTILEILVGLAYLQIELDLVHLPGRRGFLSGTAVPMLLQGRGTRSPHADTPRLPGPSRPCGPGRASGPPCTHSQRPPTCPHSSLPQHSAGNRLSARWHMVHNT